MRISHNIIDYHSFGSQRAANPEEYVRLHFGLKGRYEFHCKQLNASFDLCGHHNNILYSDRLDLLVNNKSKRIETFGIDFSTEAFVQIAQQGNEPLKRFADKVLRRENALLAPVWKTSNIKIQQVIHDILHCSFGEELRELYLLSKSLELLVLQAEQYEAKECSAFIRKSSDKKKLIEAKELLTSRMSDPPTIVELSKLVGLNEYKLKKGFKELFGTTIFGYIHSSRMRLAKRLLLVTDKSAKEIAYEAGYNSPQYFSQSFKKEFGISPNSLRKTPDFAPD